MRRSSRAVRSLAPATAIIYALERRGTLPMDFLSRSIGMARQEVEKNVALLEEAGLVKRQGQDVSLTQQDSPQSVAV